MEGEMNARNSHIVLVAGLLLLSAAGFGLMPGSTLTAGTTGAPDLELQLSSDRNIGYSPLSVTVYGKMHGLHGANGNFCHPGVTWIIWNVDRDLVTRSTSDPRCHHLGDKPYNPVVFKRSLKLGPGTHMCRLMVQGKDGRLVSSNYVRVEVH
jgi:hypothetical protein